MNPGLGWTDVTNPRTLSKMPAQLGPMAHRAPQIKTGVDSMNWLNLALLSFILSISYGIGHWMVYQGKKEGTLIPSGSFTLRFGLVIAFVLKGLCYGVIIWSWFKYQWFILAIIPVMWIISGFLARRIERLLYAKDRLESFEYHSQKFVEKFGEEGALKHWDNAVPKWWLDLMSSKWRKNYKEIVGKHLKSTDVTNLLFDREKFNSLAK